MLRVGASGRARVAILASVGAAWAFAVVSHVLGIASALHHDTIARGTAPAIVKAIAFFGGWQAMVAAMMLPTIFPLLEAFDKLGWQEREQGGGRARLSLVGGYMLVWTAFGGLAVSGDLMLHALADGSAFVAADPQVIPAAVTLLAGAYQMSNWMRRCLWKCQHPGVMLLRRYRPGARAAAGLGIEHGLTCVGCCWALMLLMFAVGAMNLLWMAALTAVMVAQKTSPWSRPVRVGVGVGLMACGLAILLGPRGMLGPLGWVRS